MATLLEVKDLRTEFHTQDGIVHAVNGVSFTVDEGETLGLVGESGCGKSVSVLSVMRLIPQPPGKIAGGQVIFQGRDLLQVDDEEIRSVRGNKIAMVFQDPMTSLNPVLTIGTQIGESLELASGDDQRAGTQAFGRAAQDGRHPGSRGPYRRLSAPVLRRHAPTRDDRHGTFVFAAALIADEPTTALGRDDSSANRGHRQTAQARAGHGDRLDHARPWRYCRTGGPHQCHVRGLCDRDRQCQRDFLQILLIRTRWACWDPSRVSTKRARQS